MNIYPVYYFPPISWFSAVAQETTVLFEAHEHYKKQRYFNRMRIPTSNKILTMSIPVVKAKENSPINKRTISYDVDWQRNQWVSITSAYRSSPFFEYYEDKIRPFFESKTESLFDHNLGLIKVLKDILQLDFEIEVTDSFQPSEAYDQDFRRAFNPRGPIEAAWFQPEPYLHVFGEGFVPDLSILDLICNQGPASSILLKQSYKNI